MTENEQLTEQYHNGTLPDGFYYYKLPNGDIEIGTDFKLATLLMCKDGNKVEVLSEVPSYQDYERLNWYAGNGIEENDKLKEQLKWHSEQLNEAVKEVAHLKELLTMAREVLKMVDTYSGDYDSINGFLIVEEINQVLGEE